MKKERRIKAEEKFYINTIINSMNKDKHLWTIGISSGLDESTLNRQDGLKILKLHYNGWLLWTPRYDISSFFLKMKFKKACDNLFKQLETKQDRLKHIFEKYCKLSLTETRKQKLKKLNK